MNREDTTEIGDVAIYQLREDTTEIGDVAIYQLREDTTEIGDVAIYQLREDNTEIGDVAIYQLREDTTEIGDVAIYQLREDTTEIGDVAIYQLPQRQVTESSTCIVVMTTVVHDDHSLLQNTCNCLDVNCYHETRMIPMAYPTRSTKNGMQKSWEGWGQG